MNSIHFPRYRWLQNSGALLGGGLLLAVLTASVHGESREFRNAAGQTLRGELLAVEADSVTIKTEDGRMIKAAASVFSPDDQIFFKGWTAPAKPPGDTKVAYQFKATFAPKRVSADRFEEGPVKVTTEKWAYQVSLESAAEGTIKDVEVRYRVFKTVADVDTMMKMTLNGPALTRVGKFAFIQGSKKMDPMTLRKVQSFSTEQIPVLKTDLKGGWYYPDGTKDKRAEDLEGIWIKVFHDGKEVFESVSNPTKFKDLKW